MLDRETTVTRDEERQVRIRAYEIWEAQGKPYGQHEANWKQALKEFGFLSPSEQPDGSTVLPDDKPMA